MIHLAAFLFSTTRCRVQGLVLDRGYRPFVRPIVPGLSSILDMDFREFNFSTHFDE
jgi:hypothetical protein